MLNLIRTNKKYRTVISLLIIIAGLFIIRSNLPDIRGGTADFRAFWSASYMLGKGENFYDESELLEVQSTETSWTKEFPLKVRNPLWSLIWFLPFSWLSFQAAAKIWLLINVFLLFAIVYLALHLYTRAAFKNVNPWIPLVTVILFPPVILVIWIGQVSLLVPFGLLLCLALYQDSRYLLAGFALSLATIKPHLVYLTIPLILMVAIKQKRWQLLAGFFISLGLSTILAIALRPGLIADYITNSADSDILRWNSSTLPALLYVETGWIWIRLIGVGLLLIALLFSYHYLDKIDLLALVNATLLMSIITAPFGWSYDFVVLLIPIVAIIVHLHGNELRQRFRISASLALITMYAIVFYQRIKVQNELFFFWVPIVVGIIYALVTYSRGKIISSKR